LTDSKLLRRSAEASRFRGNDNDTKKAVRRLRGHDMAIISDNGGMS
jgi:hypothetical protein